MIISKCVASKEGDFLGAVFESKFCFVWKRSMHVLSAKHF